MYFLYMRKAQASVVVLLILVLIAIGFLILLQFSPIITGNIISVGDRTQGSGRVISKTYDFSDFKEIEILGRGNLFITQQDDYSVRITAEDNILELLDPRVQGDKLIIGERRLLFTNTENINIHVSLPELERVYVAGSGDIKSQNKIKEDNLKIDIDGSGDVDMDVELNELNTRISGSGDCNYWGHSYNHNLVISGGGDINAFNLETKKRGRSQFCEQSQTQLRTPSVDLFRSVFLISVDSC